MHVRKIMKFQHCVESYLALLVTLGFEDMEVVKSSIDIEFCLDSGVVHLEPPEGPILDLGRRSQDESWNCC